MDDVVCSAVPLWGGEEGDTDGRWLLHRARKLHHARKAATPLPIVLSPCSLAAGEGDYLAAPTCTVSAGKTGTGLQFCEDGEVPGWTE
jgi:hypothetical protein